MPQPEQPEPSENVPDNICESCSTELMCCNACGKTICDKCSFEGKCEDCTTGNGDE